MRAFRFCTTSFTMPGSTNSPERLSSFSDSVVSSSKNSRASVRFFTSKRSAKCQYNSDLPILRASAITSPLVLVRANAGPPCSCARVKLLRKSVEKRRNASSHTQACQRIASWNPAILAQSARIFRICQAR